MTFPITNAPLYQAHSDGIPDKSDQYILPKYPEEKHIVTIPYENRPYFNATILDGGLLIHEIIVRHSKSIHDNKYIYIYI